MDSKLQKQSFQFTCTHTNDNENLISLAFSPKSVAVIHKPVSTSETCRWTAHSCLETKQAPQAKRAPDATTTPSKLNLLPAYLTYSQYTHRKSSSLGNFLLMAASSMFENI